MSPALIAALALAATDGAPSTEGLRYIEERRYYDVVASNLEQLRKRMKALQLHGPNDDPSSGMTLQTIKVQYDAEHIDGGCKLGDIAVSVEIEIVLPRLVAPRRASRDMKERWTKMIDGLTRHEEGHRDNAVRAGRELLERLKALPPTPCRDLRRAADRVHDNVVNRMQLRDQIYDQRTEHGVRQGSIL